MSVCRMCLASNVKMFNIQHYHLVETYELLANAKLNNALGPLRVCFICHAHLQKCSKLSEMVRKSDEILMDLNLSKVTPDSLATLDWLGPNHHVISLSKAPMQTMAGTILNINDDAVVTVTTESHHANKESQHANKESHHANKEFQHANKESQHANKEPNFVNEQPNSEIKEPRYVTTEPYYVIKKPHYGNKKPYCVYRQSHYVNEQPYYVNKESHYVNKGTYYVNKQPYYVNKKSPYVNKQENSNSDNMVNIEDQNHDNLSPHPSTAGQKPPPIAATGIEPQPPPSTDAPQPSSTDIANISNAKTPAASETEDILQEYDGSYKRLIIFEDDVDKKQHICHYCDVSFKCRQALWVHRRRNHSEERTCLQCGKIFKDKRCLHGHVTTHTDRGSLPSHTNKCTE